jgi:beta-glucosidase
LDKALAESPLNDGGYKKEEREKTGNGYLPISLQYRPYTAEHARAVSLAGGDFREEGKNRSYLGKTSICPNESDLENVLDAEKSGKPVIAVIRMHNPAVLPELEPHADAILCEFGIETGVLFEILFGERRAGGRLPYHLPKNMQGIEESLEDLADDYEPYRDTEGNCYERGFGLGE